MSLSDLARSFLAVYAKREMQPAKEPVIPMKYKQTVCSGEVQLFQGMQ